MGLRRLVLLVFVSLAAAGAGVQAVADATPNALLPAIPEGLGERCVEDTDFMRRNHMELLEHQRDETMLKGVRTKQYSLKECLNCHVVYGPDAQAVTVASPAHFCRACHDYAAVSIDCFDCHASRPDTAAMPAHPQVSGDFSNASTTSSGSE